ncbi:PREDICTED: uncharacterized protein LOC109344127 isoform X2 [Lupinus angustifolius]|uniref:uncharacterized protein LOC109344127 isoform X2 n=1 Tax=Lupinus angustifolius TaxID=3871 RepID=UPI00092F31C7|nr:PREDICTED: uncharacterized protein LOC109344127 isoform X2 [Lupinus angustifolius]
MEDNGKVEIMDMAIEKLILDNDDEAQYQLSLSQRNEQVLKQSKASTPSDTNRKCSRSEIDEVMKELKKIKRQNFVTQCLLSVMIVITIGWQLSEATILLKVKDGMNHPFRSFKTMLKGMIKVPEINGHEGDNKEHQSESPSLIPKMPQLDVPNLSLQNGQQD